MILSAFLLSQILAGCAVVTDGMAMHAKNKKAILLFLVVSCLLLATHFYLLKEWVAAAVVLVNGLRFLVASFTDSKKFMIFFFLLSWGSFYFLYEHWYSWFTLASETLVIISIFQKKEKNLRLFMMAETILWMIHNVFAHTPGGVIIEVLFLANNVIGYYRHHGKKQNSVPNAITT